MNDEPPANTPDEEFLDYEKEYVYALPLPKRDAYNKSQFRLRHVLNALGALEDENGNHLDVSVEALRYLILKQCRRHPNRSCKSNSKQSLCDECRDEFKHYYDRLRVRNLKPLAWFAWARDGDRRDFKANKLTPEKKHCTWAGGSCLKPQKKWGKLGLCEDHQKHHARMMNLNRMRQYYLRTLERRIKLLERKRRKRIRERKTIVAS
jgi:hypothetical protein